MSLGGKSKTKTSQQTTESATRTPTNPQWVTDAMKGFTGKVTEFGNRDPQSLVAGPSELQQQAWSQAGNLGGWRDRLEGVGDVANPGNPMLSKPTQLGSAATAQAQGYTAAEAAAERARAEQASKYMGDYLNPYLEDVVDTTLADFDANSGEVRAQQAAAAARNGAFGGSRFGIQEAATEGELARGRASTAAGLRGDAYQFAGQMGAGDADRFSNVSMHNASLGTQANLANAAARNNASAFGANANNQANMFNAGQQNQFSLTQGQMNQQNQQFNAGTKNQAVQDYMQRLDAGQGRNLQAAAIEGENSRADTTLGANLGAQQRDIEQQRRLAELMQLQSQGQLLGSANFGLFNGQQVNSTGTMNGTQTTKSSPGLMGMLGSGLMGASMLGWSPFGSGG